MVRTISQVGDMPGLIFDEWLTGLTSLRAGDAVNVSVDDFGAVHLVPVRPIVESVAGPPTEPAVEPVIDTKP